MLDIWITAYADQVQYILFFTLLAVFGLVEVLAPKRVLSIGRKERWTTNFFLTALNVVVLALLPVTFVGVAAWARENDLGLFNQFTLPVGLIAAGTLMTRGFISFMTHYTLHKFPMFWRVHRVHHLDTELDISTTVRFHPLEFLLNLLMGVQVVVIFGPS